ncbi:MAG: NTP transferase domain-containing protein [Opitutaceae bacterium]|nr:NTP transferase domain-containing protein [Opitutaceae bacterium]
MRQDKGLIRFHGVTQIERTAQLLASHCQTVYISRNKHQSAFPSTWPTIEDLYESIGPLGGILSAFKTAPTHAFLVVARDLPFLTQNSVANLISHRDPGTFATAYRNTQTGLPDPLFTIYEPSSLPRLIQAAQEKKYSPARILCSENITLLEAFDHKTLENINTPDELMRAQTYLKNDG